MKPETLKQKQISTDEIALGMYSKISFFCLKDCAMKKQPDLDCFACKENIFKSIKYHLKLFFKS
jgi:hypothetical protein